MVLSGQVLPRCYSLVSRKPQPCMKLCTVLTIVGAGETETSVNAGEGAFRSVLVPGKLTDIYIYY